MSAESSRNLLARLRDVDEHYTRLEPARGAESRLLARFEGRPSSQRRPIGLTWRNVWRPIMVIAACLAVVVISLHDEIPRAKRAHFRPLHPNMSAASTDVPRPAPKSPQKTNTPFHDSIVPAPGPTNEPPKHVPPMRPFMEDAPSLPEDSVDPWWPRGERGRRILFPRRSNPLHESQRMASFDMSSPDLYWTGAPASKLENPPRGSGGASRTSTLSEPRSHQESSETAESNATPVCQWPDALKQAAYVDCSEKGLAPTDLTFLDPCGNGQFRRETHECAEEEIEVCFTDTLGDGSTCQDPSSWKTVAHDTCAKAGQQLIDLVYESGGCGGYARMAKFTCCTPAPEPPPPSPPSCYETAPLGDGSTCKDIGLAKQEAWEACKADGSYLFDMQYAGDCPPGQASQIFVLCCDP